MNNKLIDNISDLEKEDIVRLLESYTEEDRKYAALKARKITDESFGRKIYIRGLVEISNICKNNCLYCGIRCENRNVQRYRLDKAQILSCCENGYRLGFRTFVLQGGEDAYYTDDILCDIVSSIKERYKDCAVTLSLGERSEESYRRLYSSGADRYLLRHETASFEHYAKLHPASMSFENRMNCIRTLKKIGYQTGCGMMIGSPYQTSAELAEDILFLRSFKPEMVGIGPFIPAKDTPFSEEKTGSVELTLFLLSLIRIMLPFALIPATTALQTLTPDGRMIGFNAGANVIMPNLSPIEDRKKYHIYDNKESAFSDTAEELGAITKQLEKAGYEIFVGRGDYKENERKI